MREEPRISVSDLHVAYASARGPAVEAVVGVSFDVAPGAFVTLIGPSGCGKTSLLRACGGLLRPNSGTVDVSGRQVTGPQPDAVAFVFQDFALFPWRTALGNVTAALELNGTPRAERRDRAMQALERVNLADFADHHPSQLSGGMRQRVALARALVSDADVLLLDEPFGALDEQTRMVLGGELGRLLEETGKTIVLVTHSLQEAVFLSDRILVLSARPSRVVEVIDVPLARPRQPEIMTGEEFHTIHARLLGLLYAESARSLRQDVA